MKLYGIAIQLDNRDQTQLGNRFDYAHVFVGICSDKWYGYAH